MKKLITLTSILLLISSIFFNCKNKKEEDNTGLLLALASTGGCVLQGEITADTTVSGECSLVGTVFVKNTATLTVLPGTVVKGGAGSSLFVLPGSKLIAEGTKENPIVFTSSKPVGERKMSDWGGIVLIGKAPIENRTDTPKTEGTDKQPYGTENVPDDSSGSLKYVRIEFAGNEVAAGDELNGLSLYAVGSGTKLEYIQIHFGFDDAIEFFGGRVDASYILTTGIADDDVDVDEGYAGTIKNVLAYRYTSADGVTFSSDPRAFELDGAKTNQTVPANGSTKGATNVTIENFTMIGLGTSGTVVTGVVRDCAAATFNNGDVIALKDAGTSTANLKLKLVASESDGDCNNSPNNSATENFDTSYQSATTGYVTTPWNSANPDQPPVFDTTKIKAFPGGTNWTEGWTIWRHN